MWADNVSLIVAVKSKDFVVAITLHSILVVEIDTIESTNIS